ncbi:MAG: hypothetical protein ACO1QR_07175 [Chthoniobacteraceae bacterium]
MALYNNRLDVTATTEQLAAIDAAIASVETATQFFVSLAPDERKKMVKLGPKSEDFVRHAMEAGRLNSDIVPSALEIAEMDRDKAIRDALVSFGQRLDALQRKCRDTSMVAGADLMGASMVIYRALQANGRAAGLDEVLGRLRARWDRPSRKPAEPTPEEPTQPE